MKQTEYSIYVANVEWGNSNDFHKALKMYADAKRNNSDCFVSLVKTTSEFIAHEFVEDKED